ncbi:MAG: alpha/beta family hydrolase [Pseudomonadales bacterium]
MHLEPLPLHTPAGPLSAELTLPAVANALLVLAHGAGAGFRHPNLLAISESLAAVGVATVRFNFPFMEAGRRRVDTPAVAVDCIAQAARSAAARLPDLPLFVGGHSFGGRMTSHAVADGVLTARGLVCLSFPLHPANRPDTRRAAHLARIRIPMLFLSGTRDALADRGLLAGVVSGLPAHGQNAGARLHWLHDADHGYRVRKRQRPDADSVFAEIAREIAGFVAAVAR